MKREPEHQHHVRRVVLPSGKTIEVVYFDDSAVPAEPALAAHTELDDAAADLHHCGTCGSDLVHPVDWVATTDRHWEVLLRCPNCEWRGTGVFSQDLVERFDMELDRGTDQLLDDLERLQRANMEDEIERFANALASDYIVPEDF